jgi:glycosyltransferase involved in cell wall biosynthesis
MVQQKAPFFSIVIPALNEEKYLPLLIADLVDQSSQDFEVIVIDGESTDKTVERVKKFKTKLPSLKILTSKVRNVSVQRNLGAENATGQYLLFNDADNRLPKYFLEGLKYQIHVKPTDVFTCWCLPDTDKSSDKSISTFFNMLTEASHLTGTPSAFGALIGCRRAIFRNTNGFDPKIGFSEDTDFVRRAHKKGYSFDVFREPRYVYSLRRYHKLGTMRILQKSALLNLKYLTGQKIDQKKEYPMGGGHLEKSPISSDFSKTLTSIFKQKRSKTKIADRISALLSLEESRL